MSRVTSRTASRLGFAVGAVALVPLAACLLPSLDGLRGGSVDASPDVGPDAADASDAAAFVCPKAPIATSGLVAWYPLDETTGTVVHDCAGNGYDGLVTGAATWTSGGVGGGSLAFDGTSACVIFPAVSAFEFDGNAAFSVAFFATIGTLTTPWPRYFLLGKTQNPAALGWRASVELSPPRFVLALPSGDGGTFAVASQPAPVAAGELHHVYMQYSPTGGVRVFLDGVQRGTATAPAVPFGKDSVTLRAGCSGDNQNFFAGKLDDVQIYNRALSTSEITDLAAQK